jgi:hypothetical protein
MIGVAANPNEWDTVQEFFELFKTPWEPAVAGRVYRVGLSTVGRPEDVEADLVLAYSAGETAIDRAAGARVATGTAVKAVDWDGGSFPVYCGAAKFAHGGPSVLLQEGGALDYRTRIEGRQYWRVGYGLFDEVRYLLTDGQPASHARTPTLDRHIALLKTLLVQSGVSFVEVPPHPPGHGFICCLTHDIDFFGVRRHLFDRTLAGFVARASLGTLRDLFRRRRTFSEALRNWSAVLSLPLVFLRVWPDFWRPLDDYERADGARPSTFFVIPFRGRGGAAPTGESDGTRAVKYQASEVAEPLAAAAARGRELAVHGIDAWRDDEAGRLEMAQVAPLAGRQTAGVRMHWLYFGADSPARLEAGGFEYDSTCGYNDAVGYRSGTSQVYKLPGTRNLLELPLCIMDSALFYPSRMGLNRHDALAACSDLVGNARRYGGALVVNWHDRSLAAERQWGDTYRALLEKLDASGACFMTAGEAVAWFRWRRGISFAGAQDASGLRISASVAASSSQGAVVRVFRSGGRCSELHYSGTEPLDLQPSALLAGDRGRSGEGDMRATAQGAGHRR